MQIFLGCKSLVYRQADNIFNADLDFTNMSQPLSTVAAPSNPGQLNVKLTENEKLNIWIS